VALANFLPWGLNLLHCVDGLRGVRVALAFFLLWGLDLLLCVVGLGVLRWL
jgi:hypothetical protein